jgi:hypothetical protein
MASVSFMPSVSRGPDGVDAALQASCDLLMTLQSLRVSALGSGLAASGDLVHVQRAVESVHRAIEELRLTRRGGVTPAVLGFVMPLSRARRPRLNVGARAMRKSEGCSAV